MYNIVEFFSGIGSQVKALKNLGVEVNTLGTSEWDVHAISAYDVIHNDSGMPSEIKKMGKEELLEQLKKYTFSNSGKEALEYDSFKTYSEDCLRRLYTSIIRNKNYVDISALEGKNMPDNIDVLTYSFPCQDLSNVGAFHGYKKGIDKDSGSRSSLLWQVGRILSEMKDADIKLPRFLLMENVPSLLSARHFPNFSMWINDLDQLGYVSKYYPLNAASFGLPQNRPRLLMISVYVGNNSGEKEIVLEYFKSKNAEQIVDDYVDSPYYHKYSITDFLRINYDDQELLEEAIESTPNDTVSRRKIWEDNPQLVVKGNKYNPEYDVIRTITTKQDRNPNSGNIYFDSGIEGRSTFRYLTPRECLLFMGFTDEDFERLKNNKIEFHKGDALFSRDKIIRLAGNSIPVKLLEGVFLQILKIDAALEEYRKHPPQYDDNIWEKQEIGAVKSYMFASGIRSRLKDENYPLDADIVYPKYKTAIYIKSCFWHGHGCKEGIIPAINNDFWNKLINEKKKIDQKSYENTIKMGWNVVVLWDCHIYGNTSKQYMQQLADTIRSNVNSKRKTGEVIYLE